ncbi:MAG: endonuclease III [Flavobacteriales bacterium]
MTKQEKAAFVVEELERLFPEVPIPLDHQDPFTLLIAVLLSAQSTDKKVNQVTPTLFEKASKPEEILELGEDEIRQIIKPVGLSPSKAKNIIALSQKLIEEHGGKVPQATKALEALPGVGHKTASVVMAQAFGEPAFPVDTHIHRLMYRWGLSTGKNVEQTERDCKRLFPKEKWNSLHLRIIFYGRSYSPARNFDPRQAPIEKKIGRASLFK